MDDMTGTYMITDPSGEVFLAEEYGEIKATQGMAQPAIVWTFPEFNIKSQKLTTMLYYKFDIEEVKPDDNLYTIKVSDRYLAPALILYRREFGSYSSISNLGILVRFIRL
jgi:hypothetical protein